jgi:hypothetical protein
MRGIEFRDRKAGASKLRDPLPNSNCVSMTALQRYVDPNRFHTVANPIRFFNEIKGGILVIANSDLFSWIWSILAQSILSTALLSTLGLFFKDAFFGWFTAKTKGIYEERLEKLRNENQQTIESLRASFSREVEVLKAELAKSGKEVESLRAAPLGARSARQALVDKRRLEAVDQLWEAVQSAARFKVAVYWMATVNFEKTAELGEKDPNVKQMFISLSQSMKLDESTHNSGFIARPFVSPLAWALFSAFISVIGLTRARLAVLQTGVSAKFLSNQKIVIDLLVEALPEWKARIEQFGAMCFPQVLDELESRLLAELQRMLRGEDDDAAEVERAAKIVDHVRELERQKTAANIPQRLP